MRSYYLNRGTFSVYTDREKARSKHPQEGFEYIGTFKSREDAEKAYHELTGKYPAFLNRRQ